jgi:hypothetical protein
MRHQIADAEKRTVRTHGEGACVSGCDHSMGRRWALVVRLVSYQPTLREERGANAPLKAGPKGGPGHTDCLWQAGPALPGERRPRAAGVKARQANLCREENGMRRLKERARILRRLLRLRPWPLALAILSLLPGVGGQA